MTAVVIAAPLVAALLTMLVGPIDLRRNVRIAFAFVTAMLPVALFGTVDVLSLTFTGIVSTICLLAVLFSVGAFSRDVRGGDTAWSRKPVYFVLLGAFWSAMLLVVLSTNFAALWLGISATTLATAFLVGFSGDSTALEAAWKYVVLCSVGIAFALLGIALLGRVSLDMGIDPDHALAWSAIIGHPAVSSRPFARLATTLMLLGFAAKAGLVPMHAWLPDAHSKAPAPISGLLSGVLVSCALYAIMRTSSVAAALGTSPSFQGILLWLGTASIVVAGASMLTQRDLKRLLAYSTVEHAGIVAVALGFGGPLGTFAALFHVIAHAFAKSSAFFATGLVQDEVGTTSLSELHGLWASRSAGRFLLGALAALGGMPPFGLFVSELLMVAAGVMAHQWVVLGLCAGGVVLGFAALTRAAINVESSRAPEPAASIETGVRRPSPLSVSAAAAALACAFAVAVTPWTSLGAALVTIARGLGPVP